jgi:O-acetyl-ADP-ribose deacetylase (regulator of RNase III)
MHDDFFAAGAECGVNPANTHYGNEGALAKIFASKDLQFHQSGLAYINKNGEVGVGSAVHFVTQGGLADIFPDGVMNVVGPDCKKKDQKQNAQLLLEKAMHSIIICAQQNKIRSLVLPPISRGKFKYDVATQTRDQMVALLQAIKINDNTLNKIIICTNERQAFWDYVVFSSQNQELKLIAKQ